MTAALEYLSAQERQAYDAVVSQQTGRRLSPVEDAIASALEELARRRERDAGQPPTAQDDVPSIESILARVTVWLDAEVATCQPDPTVDGAEAVDVANLACAVEALDKVITRRPIPSVLAGGPTLTAAMGTKIARHVYAALDAAGHPPETASLGESAVLEATDELLIGAA